MADKADQALKLAQKLEKDLKALEKKFLDLHNDQTTRMNEIDKRYTDAHNQQSKELEKVMAWAKGTFAVK